MSSPDFDCLIVGAGFAGMYQLHLLRGNGYQVQVLEAGSGVGGTWYWNRYPGARCDVESVQYSYQFDDALQQEWDWSERYATQPEILRYAEHVAERFDLKRDIRFDTPVVAARYDEVLRLWSVETGRGETLTARFVVMATGCLSSPNEPRIEGQETFAGSIFHTGRWPHEGVDFTGQRVAVIGTGSSAIQSIPVIARQAAELTVFQRTANYAVPAHNRALDDAYRDAVKRDYPALRARAKRTFGGIDVVFNPESALDADAAARAEAYEARWAKGGLGFLGAYQDLLYNADANRTAADFVRAKIRDAVEDPATADLLTPTNVIGCKRLCVDIGYFETYNLPHVHLVDIAGAPIECIEPGGIRAHGRLFEVDAIVFATGFDAMTGALSRIEIRGKGGRALAEKWREGPKSYLGLAIAGFPNLFTVTGPGSPSVLTNMLPTIEQHVEWIARCIDDVSRAGETVIEADGHAEEAWVAHGREVAELSLRSTCSSWYVGANVPGKPRVFMPYIGGMPRYIETCDRVVQRGYEGFVRA